MVRTAEPMVMAKTLREVAIHALDRAAAWLGAIPAGSVYQFDPNLDTMRGNITKSLTFAKIERIALGLGL